MLPPFCHQLIELSAGSQPPLTGNSHGPGRGCPSTARKIGRMILSATISLKAIGTPKIRRDRAKLSGSTGGLCLPIPYALLDHAYRSISYRGVRVDATQKSRSNNTLHYLVSSGRTVLVSSPRISR